MNVTLLKALAALLPVGILFLGSLVLVSREKAVSSFLQILGAACLAMVVLMHVCEALHLFPWMHWGSERSVGHYLDFWVPFLVLRCSPSDICFMRSQNGNLRTARPARTRTPESRVVTNEGLWLFPVPQNTAFVVIQMSSALG